MSGALRLVHRLRYQFEEPAKGAELVVRLRPKRAAHHQLLVTPAGDVSDEKRDRFGNAITKLRLDSIHELTIAAVSVLPLGAHPVAAAAPPQADAATFLTPSARVGVGARFASLIDDAPTPESVAQTISELLRFDRQRARAEGTAQCALDDGAGVCQDFVHVALAALRSRGVPARYVGGYLLPAQPRDPVRPHAWASMACPKKGWLDFDPTFGGLTSEHHAAVAIGRDHHDAAAVCGQLLSADRFRLQSQISAQQLAPLN